MRERIADWLSRRGPAAGPGEVEALALELYAWQVRHVPAYAAFAAGAQPATIEEIPAVPVPLFRDVRFCAASDPTAVFLTSGTTSGRRGAHCLPDTTACDIAIRLHFWACLPDCPTDPALSLVPHPTESPDSSLGHMVQVLAPNADCFFHRDCGLDRAGAWRWLERVRRPAFVVATAFALAELLDGPESCELPPGSVVVITGGFKGRTAELSPAGLVGAARAALGPGPRIVHEYGMTELSSQLWDTGQGYVPPPWLHAWTIDPASGRRCSGPGLLCFVDLANWGSCLAIETGDLGQVRDGRVRLLGRLPGSRSRGCSLAVEEAR